MPELHPNSPAHRDSWAPTVDEMERMFRALDPDATHEIAGPQKREYAICIACAHGDHETPGARGLCDCACHATPPAEHECNDCGIMIENWRPICTLCEHWYEDHGLPLPAPPATTPRKQTDLREFYRDPIAFGLRLAMRRSA